MYAVFHVTHQMPTKARRYELIWQHHRKMKAQMSKTSSQFISIKRDREYKDFCLMHAYS